MTTDPLRDLGAAFQVAALQLERAKDDKGAEQLRRWGARANAAPISWHESPSTSITSSSA